MGICNQESPTICFSLGEFCVYLCFLSVFLWHLLSLCLLEVQVLLALSLYLERDTCTQNLEKGINIQIFSEVLPASGGWGVCVRKH